MKLELLTNATVIDDAIRFVASNAAKITEKTNSDKTIAISGYVAAAMQSITKIYFTVLVMDNLL
jgi:hypothetical protein